MFFAQFITVLRLSRSFIGVARGLVIIAASIRMSMFRQVRLCMGEEPEMAEFHTDRLMKRPWDTKMKSWLGGLDSNQDSQLQRLMYYRLYDLPVVVVSIAYAIFSFPESGAKGQSRSFDCQTEKELLPKSAFGTRVEGECSASPSGRSHDRSMRESFPSACCSPRDSLPARAEKRADRIAGCQLF